MNTTICFIRHGETNINKELLIQGRQDHLLNEAGIKQAHSVGKYLHEHDHNWDVIYSSPLSRALNTATIIATEIGYKGEIITDEALLERDFGETEGKKVCPEIFQEIYDNTFPTVESNEELQHRVVNKVKEILVNNEGKRILVITHSHVIKSLLIYISKNASYSDPIYNCSLNYFSYEKDVIFADRINVTV